MQSYLILASSLDNCFGDKALSSGAYIVLDVQHYTIKNGIALAANTAASLRNC